MSITVLQTKNFECVHARVHAADNRKLAFWVDLEMTAIEAIGIPLVVPKKFIGDRCKRIFR